MGRPTNTGPVSDVIGWIADHTVVSVGPYIFHTAEALAANSFASSRGRASPPHSTLRSALPSQPALTSKRHVVGVACMQVAPEVARLSRNRRPSVAVFRLTRITRAPTMSGR